MKKFFSLFCLIAMAVVSFSFVACSSKDDPVADEPEKPVQEPRYARFEIQVVEDLFELGDFVVTLEYDGKKETYKLDASTKVGKVTLKDFDSFFDDRASLPGRVLVVGPFQFETLPVKYTGEIVFNEDAKKRMQDAPEEDQIDFAIFAKLQNCKKDGSDAYPAYNQNDDMRVFRGVYVKGFDGFLQTLGTSYVFSQKL